MPRVYILRAPPSLSPLFAVSLISLSQHCNLLLLCLRWQVAGLRDAVRHRDDQLASLRTELARLEATRDRCDAAVELCLPHCAFTAGAAQTLHVIDQRS